MLFSIILPVYNVENYLDECLKSIINQTYNKNYEIIIVNDGSTDNSYNICKNYEKKYSNFIIINKKNEGLYKAWNDGIKLAKGEYVISIDSDDKIDKNLLTELENIINNCSPDMLVYGYQSFNENNDKIRFYKTNNDQNYYNKEDIKNKILPNLINIGSFENRNIMYLSRINKVIKKNIILKNLDLIDNCSYGEDNLWTIPNVLDINSLYIFDKNYCPYYYRYNINSITHSYNPNLWEKFKKLNLTLIELLKNKKANDLIEQIYKDSVFHGAICINNSMYIKNKKECLISLKEICNDELIIKGTKLMNTNLLSTKERINLYLIKHKYVRTLYLLKHIKGVKK